MKKTQSIMPENRRLLLQACPLSAKAPFEIYGARNRGCRPGDSYLYRGYRYIQYTGQDVLIREDVDHWIKAQQETPKTSSSPETMTSHQ